MGVTKLENLLYDVNYKATGTPACTSAADSRDFHFTAGELLPEP